MHAAGRPTLAEAELPLDCALPRQAQAKNKIDQRTLPGNSTRDDKKEIKSKKKVVNIVTGVKIDWDLQFPMGHEGETVVVVMFFSVAFSDTSLIQGPGESTMLSARTPFCWCTCCVTSKSARRMRSNTARLDGDECSQILGRAGRCATASVVEQHRVLLYGIA